MKFQYTYFVLFLVLTINCAQPPKNEVIVLGMIHSGHRTSELYGLEILKDIIREIDPDYILTEIPPDRFDAAMIEFIEKDTVTEPRVRVFPEYVDVVFPLTKEMNFEIIPTAGWTKQMNDHRNKVLREISRDPDRKEDWEEYQTAVKRSQGAFSDLGPPDDPYIVNSDLYDAAGEIRYEVYNRLFNDEIGLGGWDNINKAHYWYISKALDEHLHEGKRFLITYGAGHKGWFLRELRKRHDIILLDVKPFLDNLGLNNK